MEVRVKSYDPAWADDFDSAASLAATALGRNVIAVHHIGSTAIPNIFAKPIIDIMIAVTDIDAVDTCTQEMSKLGYEAKGEFGIPTRRYFRKDDIHGKRTHQIHVFPYDSDQIERHLAFRDYLIAHPEWATCYSDLKRDLAEKYSYSIAEYNAGKDSFIKQVDTMASAWRRKTTG